MYENEEGKKKRKTPKIIADEKKNYKEKTWRRSARAPLVSNNNNLH